MEKISHTSKAQDPKKIMKVLESMDQLPRPRTSSKENKKPPVKLVKEKVTKNQQ